MIYAPHMKFFKFVKGKYRPFIFLVQKMDPPPPPHKCKRACVGWGVAELGLGWGVAELGLSILTSRPEYSFTICT